MRFTTRRLRLPKPKPTRAYDDGAYDAIDDGSDEGAVLAGPTIREFLSGILQPRMFIDAEEVIQRTATPLSNAALSDADFSDTQFGTATVDRASLDDTPLNPADFGRPVFSQGMAPTFDDSVFDTSAYGDAPSLGETAMYETPAFGMPAYEGTPSHGVDDFEDTPPADAGVTEEFAAEALSDPDAPTYADSPDVRGVAARGDDARDRSERRGVSSTRIASRAGARRSLSDEHRRRDRRRPERVAARDAPRRSEAEPEEIATPVERASTETSSCRSRPSTRQPPSMRAGGAVADAVVVRNGDRVRSTRCSPAPMRRRSTPRRRAPWRRRSRPEVPETPPLQGMPAHRAADELSLDHVFKSNPAPRQEAEGEGFSFDQFFADDMNEAAPKPGAEATSSAAHGAGDDIAQFNNWLNGLKKT